LRQFKNTAVSHCTRYEQYLGIAHNGAEIDLCRVVSRLAGNSDGRKAQQKQVSFCDPGFRSKVVRGATAARLSLKKSGAVVFA
jgi:hypothetical protein